MKPIHVWAPNATQVTLIADGRELQLHPESDGMFAAAQPLPTGTRYRLRLDDVMELPDPRSMCQPEGPHGPSEAVDPANFTWTDASWDAGSLLGKVFYELHIGTFTPGGTFRSAIEKLDYLKDLGVDVVQLMPIAPIPGKRGWGYDGVSIYAIHPEYGRPEDLAALVDAIHARGMAACLDVVYNHFGPDGNYLGQFGPYFTDKHQTPWGAALNLDGAGSKHVREYLIGNALQWLRDYHFDALRLDAVHYLLDDSPRHFLAELADRVRELSADLGRTLTLTAESELNEPAMVAREGYGMDMQWADDVHHALHVWLSGEKNAYYVDYTDPGTMKQAFEHGFVRVGQELKFPGAPRGKAIPEGVSGHRFMAFDENHDQVGNRLLSDRPSTHLSPAQLAVSRALILTSHYTPMLFMGEEWGTKRPFQFFTDHSPEIGDGILEGRRHEFAGWDFESVYADYSGPLEMIDPQSERAFLDSKLDWEAAQDSRLLEFVRALIKLRRTDPDIASGDRTRTELHLDAADAKGASGGSSESEIPAGESGWMRRGNTVVVFSKADGTRRVVAPIEGKQPVLSWDEVKAQSGVVQFDGPGVAIFR